MIIAKAKIFKRSKRTDEIVLTDQSLMITYRKKLTHLPLDHVESIQFQKRKLFAPLIFGGIAFCLVHLLYFKGFLPPLMASGLSVIFALIGYYGWHGTNTLYIKEHGMDHDFLISHVSVGLKGFVHFTTMHLHQKRSSSRQYEYIMLFLSKQKATYFDRPNGQLIAETFEQWQINPKDSYIISPALLKNNAIFTIGIGEGQYNVQLNCPIEKSGIIGEIFPFIENRTLQYYEIQWYQQEKRIESNDFSSI